eukprot:TRINITY_DN91483_c0_g1_i1.p1 TRINITY_DN91483_c0_g1~~TRINITY_DN91483_c0_g1_i1.p1  ORF type:complete len:419 (-),score=49.83 TRINITY_DN91483_c0_g1_i1:122-1378(-)
MMPVLRKRRHAARHRFLAISAIAVVLLNESGRSGGQFVNPTRAETEHRRAVLVQHQQQPIAITSSSMSWSDSPLLVYGSLWTHRNPSRVLRNASAGGELGFVAFALAALSSFFNGSFPVCQRIPKAELDPVLFNGVVCLGVFLSSLLVPAAFSVPWVFTVGGAIGGALFVFAALFSFIAIPKAGLATAQAVWSCSAILVSFAWGAFGPAEIAAPVRDVIGSAEALILLVAGALLIVNCESIAKIFSGEKETQTALNGEHVASEERAGGIASAIAVGFFGGSVLVPFKFIPPEAAGLAAVPSFGLGALLAGLIVSAGYWKIARKEGTLPTIEGDQLLAGCASGALWNAGNVCSIIAQSPPYSLPYGIAYPILQCALFFGGLWGIFVFKEIQGNAIVAFWAGAATLAGGIILLSVNGPGA